MMRGSVPVALRRRVRERAKGRCEYCRIHQSGQEATFHIDHVLPVRARGPTSASNLALACVSCSLRKGARTHARDPETLREVRLFNPRRDPWQQHFGITEALALVGLTPTGRATVELLRMNRVLALEIRREEALRGRFSTRGV